MWLKLDVTISDMADEREIESLKVDIEKALKYHEPWIIRPKGLPEIPTMTHTGIVDDWEWNI